MARQRGELHLARRQNPGKPQASTSMPYIRTRYMHGLENMGKYNSRKHPDANDILPALVLVAGIEILDLLCECDLFR